MNDRTRCVAACMLGLLALLGLPPGELRAEDEPPAAPAATDDARPAPRVGVIQGNRVNLRVGPRPGGRPVARLDDGTVLLIVEQLEGWTCVHVPSGFLGAVSAKYIEPVGADAVRITAGRLNMRVAPPEEGRPMPAPFRDQLTRGAVLPLIERSGDWLVVMAPESTRVYVSSRYVKELGPLADHEQLVDAARKRRTAYLEQLARQRRELAARKSGATLRAEIGRSQQALYKLQMARGIQRAPVMEVITALEAQIELCRIAPVGVRKLAHAVRQDLEAELEIRMARKDAEVARLRGLDPPAEKPRTPTLKDVSVRGTIRWEAAPTWRNGGEWVLWVGEDPKHVLQLTTGLPHPLPDFKANAEKGLRTVRGRQSGARVFGLPVLEVRSIKP